MDAAGYMGSNPYAIYHPGLLQIPGNVMIELGAVESLNISGILDWDGAVFHPSFHGCEIPVWLWDGEYSYDAYGNLIEETPATIEQQQIKQAFENAVGAEYLHRARAPGYGLARQLIPLAVGGRHLGFNFNPDEKVNDLLDLWGTICPPGMPQIQRIEKAPSNNEVDSEEEFEIDGIVDARRFAGGHVKYMIKWTGYEEPTWQPYSDISHLEDELRAFEAANPLKPIHRKRAQHLRQIRAKYRRR